MMEIAHLVVSICGVIVTGVFSYFIWQANKQSANAAEGATRAAEESASISKMMLEMQEEQKQNIRQQLKRDVIKQINAIERNLSNMLSTQKYSEIMSRLPEEINITNLELANYFLEEEIAIIYKTRSTYETYRNDYFKNDIPSFSMDEKFIHDNKTVLELTRDVIIALTIHG
ncbi:hypothetical protein [Sporosarcina sp. E16_8]|uniref:hypothetical protein n=1 Tax=Sporosarcina sp. E16_8 TaxID=2789295 RepID=UPI001A921C15|nr:hypothetical protein [Sporosarcina sp. E16_8]MBO0588399.1 hypothetical protein [Sporosarcina sp. E16_8]